MTAPQLSVVIPVYNEEAGLPALFARLYPALDALARRLRGHLRQRRQPRPLGRAAARTSSTRARTSRASILFNANFGQHMAIMAGFERVRGERVVTLDADLQNPPEEIAQAARGDGRGPRLRRRRSAARARTPGGGACASRAMNRLRERITRIQMTDQGCMLRAYSRDIVDAIAASREVSTFIPALAYTFAHNPTEIEVAHEERAAGESKYSLYS